jgi:flagellum-specific peptidoglycan hydrolase FlgJ
MTLFPPEIVAAAQAAEKAFYPTGPFVSIILAQWALESGYGRYQSGENNYFGIKATAAEIASGHATRRLTHETIGGVYRPMYQYFANYPDLAAGFIAHSALLSEPCMQWAYGVCWRAETPQAYAHALKAHYATGEPGAPYDTVLIKIMDDNDLYQFDVKH